MPAYELKINGQVRKLNVAADTPLLWALRDELDLVGTKYGCGLNQCGACTVHVNGVATRSCMTRVSNVGSAAITTIEGLSPDGSHPVQKAWVRLDVPQCGYCQAGQIMSAVALLAKNQQPSDADIDAALSGNLCRCCTYPRIRRAVQEAAAAMRGEALSDSAGVEMTAGLACESCASQRELQA